jgi:hypothetical protein
MREAVPSLDAGALRAFCASYDELPVMPARWEPAVDLRREPPFDAAIVGWTSFSHLVTDAARVHALRQVGALTQGPILVSYFGHELSSPESHYRVLRWLHRRADRWGHATFTTAIGFSKLFTEEELRDVIARAGLTADTIDRDATWPFAIVHRACPPKPRRGEGG